MGARREEIRAQGVGGEQRGGAGGDKLSRSKQEAWRGCDRSELFGVGCARQEAAEAAAVWRGEGVSFQVEDGVAWRLRWHCMGLAIIKSRGARAQSPLTEAARNSSSVCKTYVRAHGTRLKPSHSSCTASATAFPESPVIPSSWDGR